MFNFTPPGLHPNPNHRATGREGKFAYARANHMPAGQRKEAKRLHTFTRRVAFCVAQTISTPPAGQCDCEVKCDEAKVKCKRTDGHAHGGRTHTKTQPRYERPGVRFSLLFLSSSLFLCGCPIIIVVMPFIVACSCRGFCFFVVTHPC